jgi:hypothetical protein
MTVDARWESLYRQVELVRGVGDRKRGKMCVMSFVAFLAGEEHSDNPTTASPLIRQFAITINDNIPDHMRQRLKSFAPRILGTSDGYDRARARVLIEALRAELLPRIVAEFGFAATRDGGMPHGFQGHRKAMTLPQLHEQAVRLFSYASDPGDMPPCEEAATAVARLIAHCGRIARTPEQRDWYWVKAIELLDRLCDISADQDRPGVPAERLSEMEAFLERRNERQQGKARAVAAFTRVRNLIPALVR